MQQLDEVNIDYFLDSEDTIHSEYLSVLEELKKLYLFKKGKPHNMAQFLQSYVDESVLEELKGQYSPKTAERFWHHLRPSPDKPVERLDAQSGLEHRSIQEYLLTCYVNLSDGKMNETRPGETQVTDSERQIFDSERQNAASEGQGTDSERQVADGERRNADSERQVTESERQVTDSERQVTGSERLVLGSERQDADTERQVTNRKIQNAASEGQDTDSERQVAEGERQGADNERQDADSERQVLGSERQDADTERQVTDRKRQNGVSEGQDTDSERQVADSERKGADNERQDADNERQVAGGERQVAVIERQHAYRLFKHIIKLHVVPPAAQLSSESQAALTSYHLETILLWMSKRLPPDYWSWKNLSNCYLGEFSHLLR